MKPIESAIDYLIGHGAHMVLCTTNKRPLRRWRWRKAAPSRDVCVAHYVGRGLPLGIVPASVETSALDIDSGDPRELLNVWPPLVAVSSKRRDVGHAYYSDDVARGNGRWSAYGCRGDIRSGKGYLCLWHDAIPRLAEALENPPRSAVKFPRDLFEACGVPLPAARPQRRVDEVLDRRRVAAKLTTICLEDIEPGGRNVALFNVVRGMAYAMDMRGDIETWHSRVLDVAMRNNRRFSVPLAPGEVAATAYSVSTWTASGHGPINHDPVVQARRGRKSGVVRRAAVSPRDAAIIRAVAAGESMKALGRRMGIPYQTIHSVVSRDAPLLKQGVGRPGLDEPWVAAGVSRRTWFRTVKKLSTQVALKDRRTYQLGEGAVGEDPGPRGEGPREDREWEETLLTLDEIQEIVSKW